ncbi:hypothetical protein EI983_11880 [Roseovarius faecimaris]|uniref:Lipid/polyisoprenoid-binding YceI-like domain-containing protein n=1 Tax=Roseovarius faecimaris TaxID=2494550 RepID=A0A6I6IRY4_9RHOB|nr:YceI family protein [Roseovarius faecimaris]QGX98932.1 hypothetical protein EI983_11880 [Roseovarius faecimaris]
MRMLCLLLICLAGAALADAERYTLDAARSQVGFSYLFEGAPRDGTMPVQSARILLDLDNLPASEVEVTLDARRAKAGFVFATEAMKSPEVLDVARHPVIRFRSTQFRGDLRGATVTGDLTVRGITRPVTLRAELYRQRGTQAGDRSRLTVLLTGTIDRNDFGASGYPGLVGPQIGLRILARITR